MIVLRSAGVELPAHGSTPWSPATCSTRASGTTTSTSWRCATCGTRTIKIHELIGTGKDQKRMDEVPLAQITHYAAEDADVAWRLRPPLAARMKEAELEQLFDTVEMPLVEVLVELEHNGIRVDVELLGRLSAKYGARVTELEGEIHELAGREFNIGSPKQLQADSVRRAQAAVVKRTKTGGSTDADVLEELARLHPLPAKIMEYRQYAKLKNTYVDALPQLVHPATGRVHASFNQVVAATGRLSSNDPNLQNIPIRSETGREIRAAFLPGQPAGSCWRPTTRRSSCGCWHIFRATRRCARPSRATRTFTRAWPARSTACRWTRSPADMRRSAKAVNFGVIYGQSPFGLARQLNIEKDEAARFIDAYFDRYPGVEEFLAQILEECPKTGYVKTILGRRRAIRGIRRGTSRQRNLPERTAINTVIQGSAADLIKLAMIHVHRRLRREKLAAKMLLQIHDELVFEVPPDELDHVAQLVREEMSGVMPLSVPLKVDLKSGDNWADCQEWNM